MVQRLLGQVGAEERVEHPAARDRGRLREVARGESLAERHEVGPQPALLGREQRAGAAEARSPPRRRSAARRARGTRRRSALERRRARRAACRPRPARAARRSRPRARPRASPTMRAATSKQSGSAKRGARSTGKRSGSNTSVPNPPSPTESAPMVSPWYAPPKARNVVRPRTPWFDQYWNAIFSACSTALAPSDGEEEVGLVDRHDAARAPRASSTTTRLPLPSIVECAPRSSCARSASSSSGTRCPSVLTHSDEIASR